MRFGSTLCSPVLPGDMTGSRELVMANDERSPLRTTVTPYGAVVFNMRSGELKPLNSTGAYVWQALQRGEAIDVIAVNLARDTGEELSVVQSGVAAFVAELQDNQLWPR